MSVALFGTCRIGKIMNNNELNEMVNYTRTTKEVIQIIQFLKGELIFPYPYNIICFRWSILNNNTPINYNFHNKTFSNTDIFVIELCSIKKYVHNGFYIHEHKTDKTPSVDHTLEYQSDEEIENDILEIRKILHPKKIVIVSHYNAKVNGEYLPARDKLINLLDYICKKYNIFFINPTNVLSNYSQELILADNGNDIQHYNEFGMNIFTNYMNNFLKTII